MSDVPAESGPLAPGSWKILSVAILGSFLSNLDATIVNVSLSSLASDLHTALGTIQWVTSGYLLALTLILPLNGWLVDRIGAKALYLWCFSAFTLSSALCGLAWSAPSLIGFRILQGLAGGLLAPMAQMMIARVAGKQMARVAGYATLPILLAPLLGPVIAGAILQYASWRWLFLVNVPVGVLAIALAALFLPSDRDERRPRELDLQGLALLSPALVLFLYGADRVGEPMGLSLFLLSLVLLAAFFWTALRKGKRALIDLQLFRSPLFSIASIAQFLSNGTTFAGQMLIPLYLIDAAGRSPGEMGWLMAPLGLGMLCTFPSMGFLTKHLGTRGVAAGGALLATLATAAFIYLSAYELNLAVLAAALFLRGVGLGGVGIPSMTAAYSSVPRSDLPMATTTLNIVQRLGGPSLTTLCATFLGWQLSSYHAGQSGPTPYMWAFALLCGLHAATLLAALGFPARAQRAG
ncbi:MAG: DHA2 family efflux MFS transporter permease subunit [Devosia sp.]|nr:DHA2 family efflux MFS transporter permease subunit [Devosia sp.]